MEWKLAYAHHDACCTKEYCTIAEIEGSGFPIIPAVVPGNFELDLMREGLLEDLYYSTNTLKAQELEDVHLWYYTTVEVTDSNQYLEFEGIDTFADIYVNGRLVKSADNMFLTNAWEGCVQLWYAMLNFSHPVRTGTQYASEFFGTRRHIYELILAGDRTVLPELKRHIEEERETMVMIMNSLRRGK